ncbi:MAG: peptidase and chymotrypsin/Hap [Solirubrobacterales bacterium]|nr:peptidase and chymotrypsin/Hap [Solirubrobacterales bacterium]
MSSLLRLLTLAAVLAGVVASPAGAVVGGTRTPAGAGSFVVALVDSSEGRRTVAAGQFCAATVVAPDALVTAAHCLEDEDGYRTDADDIRIFAGQVLPLRKGTLLPVRSLKTHPDFDDGAGEANADVGVIRLRKPLKGVTAIPLAAPEDAGSWQPGVSLGLWGWGNRATGEGQNFPRQLHDGVVQRYTDARCDDLYGRYFNAATQLCAGTPDGRVDACQGDSGGPLTATRPNGRVVLVGVVSYGEGCGKPEFPTVYTKLSRYRTFLAGALKPQAKRGG